MTEDLERIEDVPMSELVRDDRERIRIEDMAEYSDVFFAVENATLQYWFAHPEIKDRDVLASFNRLLRNPDSRKDPLTSEISMGVKAVLVMRREEGERDYTHGEFGLLRAIDSET